MKTEMLKFARDTEGDWVELPLSALMQTVFFGGYKGSGKTTAMKKHPQERERSSIDEATGFKRSTRDAYILRLSKRQLVVEGSSGGLRANPQLFDEGGA